MERYSKEFEMTAPIGTVSAGWTKTERGWVKSKMKEPPSASIQFLDQLENSFRPAVRMLATIPQPLAPTSLLCRDLDGGQWTVLVRPITRNQIEVTFDRRNP